MKVNLSIHLSLSLCIHSFIHPLFLLLLLCMAFLFFRLYLESLLSFSSFLSLSFFLFLSAVSRRLERSVENRDKWVVYISVHCHLFLSFFSWREKKLSWIDRAIYLSSMNLPVNLHKI
ncbi:hypothetical protein CSUI_007270 [Cystoisospora suis]|uniref:Transmembrane protein n=1 Tax=Cystoisospora suis TaxID=483139 RepID=A0A2C6KR10_9APIC|nr:hypothetical protein CSUI_007270 [Cystoisospora suis]